MKQCLLSLQKLEAGSYFLLIRILDEGQSLSEINSRLPEENLKKREAANKSRIKLLKLMF
jgi:hypothetical protein